MSAWVKPGSGGGSGRQFYGGGSGAPSALGGVYHPSTSEGGGSPAEGPAPGVVSINPLDPQQTQKDAGQAIGDLLSGLRAGIFGTDASDGKTGLFGNGHGGLLGDIPLLGDAGRAVTAVPGAVGQVAGDALKTASPLERIDLGGDRNNAAITEQFAAIPEEFKQQFAAEYEGQNDKGLFGTGFLGTENQVRAATIRAWAEKQQFENPTLFGSRFKPAGSLMGALQNAMDLLGASGDLAQRGVAGAGKFGDEGRNRLQQIMYVGDSNGTVAFTADAPGLNPVEQITYAKVKSGAWTEPEALDFLATHNAGYSHEANLQLAATFGLDPLNAASFGAAGLAKAGIKGAEFLAAGNRAAKLLEDAKLALTEAKAAGLVDDVARLEGEVTTAEKALAGFDKYVPKKAPRAINVAGRAASGSENAAAFLRLAGKTYKGLQGTQIGRAAKLTRTLIDPLHAIDLRMPGSTRMMDLYSDSLVKSVVDTAGANHHYAVLEDLTKLDPSGVLRNQFSSDLAVATANRGREGAATLHRAANIDSAEALVKIAPDELIEQAIKTTRERDIVKWLKLDALKNVVQRDWDGVARQELARRLEATYGMRDAAEWTKSFEKMSVERMSLLKFAAYGSANRKLLNGVSKSKVAGMIEVGGRQVDDMVLVSASTLSRMGAETLVGKIERARGVAAKVALIREWQERFPVLRYISIDEANPGRSIEQFTGWLSDQSERFPMLVTHDELKTLHPDLQDLQGTLGDGYRLGFKPDDQFLWGLERANDVGGAYRVASAPWLDHVADGGLGYRPGRALRLNVAGNPIVGMPLKASAKALDYMEIGGRMLKTQISSAMVTEMARQRFVSQATRGKFANEGLTEGVADKLWDRIQEYTREHQGYSGPRGFSKGDIYNDLYRERLIPHTLLNGAMRLTENDVMRMVMEAYDGDIRMIGLTQKLSSRAKAYLFQTTGSNFAGQISEHAWPLLKFRYNPIFQLQEKIEPWVLNAQRGVTPVFGVTANAADAATERLLQKMTDNSLIRQADLDQAEYAAANQIGKGYEALGTTQGTKLNKINSMARAIMEVQGTKRLGALRTFRAGLGKELRGAWETTQPGVWDDMKQLADARAGHLLDEDEFAIGLMGEQLFANDIMVSRLAAAGKELPDFENAIKTAHWHTPTALGELMPLDLDHVAKSLAIPGVEGRPLKTLGDLRRYLGEDPNRLKEVTEGLNRLKAHPDYITRVENALTFSWTGFWKTASERFGLTKQESGALQNMVAGAAELRGMSPADFLSQVFDPHIKDGIEGSLGSLERAKDLRAKLAGTAGESTREDLVRQMSTVFADYLDPSAKKALLMEFRPELRQAVRGGKVHFEPEDLKAMWGDVENSQLADRIVGYMDGKLGSGVHVLIDDEARGVAAVRKVATRYMEERGVTPHPERWYYEVDEALYEDSARAYSALPEVPFEKTGRAPRLDAVKKAGLDLKPKPAGVDDRTYEAYEDFVTDTRQQWDFMTRSKKEGGLGIEVSFGKGDPYPDSAAMRADVAKGRLKVFAGDSDHPLLTNEQNVMFRAIHDVFGHAAEGFEFGPRGELNAAIKHSQMYSDTGRAAMLTETHGQTSWVNFSDEPVPGQAFVPAETWEQAREAYRSSFPDVSGVAVDKGDLNIVWDYETSLGQGIDLLANNGLDGEMTELVNTLHGLRAQFPDVPLPHIDATDLDAVLGQAGVQGLAIGAPDGKTALIFNEKMWTDPNFAQRALQGEAEFGAIKPGEVFTGGGETMFRYTDEGAPFARGAGDPMSVVYHEYGHGIDTWLRYGKPTVAEELLQPYLDFADDFTDMQALGPKWMQKAQKQLSEYARTSDEEGMAELLGVALNPKVDRAALPTELRRAVEQLEGHIDSMGLRAKPAAAGTVREANAVKRGSVYAPQKAGLLDQSILDQFGEQFVGKGKHVESNPDVARTAQMFGKWTSKVVEDGLMRGEQSVHGELLNNIAGIPTKDAVPYNLTEALTHQLAYSKMADKWNDAYRLQYFAQERSMLERSVNHPMFGLYPASYMWGKLGPEVIQFLAQRPFGLRTGGLAYGLADVQAAIAMQREFDAGFDSKIEELGHSQALSFLGYLMPTLPWDVSASAPSWMKDIASQGLKSQAQVAGGGQAEGFNALKPTVDTIDKLNPLSTTLPWLARGVGEVTDKQDLANSVQEPVAGTGLAEPLALAMEELRASLSR